MCRVRKMLSGENMRLWLWAELSNADVQGPPSCETWQPRGDFAAGYRNVWSSSGYNLRWNVWAGILKQLPRWLATSTQSCLSGRLGLDCILFCKLFLPSQGAVLSSIISRYFWYLQKQSLSLSTMMLPIIAATICFWKKDLHSVLLNLYLN